MFFNIKYLGPKNYFKIVFIQTTWKKIEVKK